MRLYAILAVTTVALSLPQTASGDTNGFMRRLGFAWSDGYHSQTMQAYGSGGCANGNCGGRAARPHSPHTIVHGTHQNYGTHQYHGTPQYQGRMRPLPTPATRQEVIPVPTDPNAVLPRHQPPNTQTMSPIRPHGRVPLVPPTVQHRRPQPQAFRWSTARLPAK
jgi:hypothetical protein